MKAVILAAGQGQRMGDLTRDIPKALLPIGGETVIRRVLRQLFANNIDEVRVVTGFAKDRVESELAPLIAQGQKIRLIENARFREDVNIFSLYSAVRDLDEPYIIIEGDVIFDDDSIAEVCRQSNGKTSIWFTHGSFAPSQNGGILLSVGGKVQDVRIVPKFETAYLKYKKSISVMTVGGAEVSRYRELLAEYCAVRINQYYHQPWIDHQAELPSREIDLQANIVVSFNTESDYRRAKLLFEGELRHQVQMIPVKDLKHIEGFSKKRVDWLKNKIVTEEVWTQPLKIEANHNLVLDGQHRFEVAMALGLEKVPCQLYDYDEVEVWSLRPKNHPVERKQVIDRANEGDLYPYKTVKHRFPNPAKDFSVPLKDLGWKKQ